MIVRDNKGKSYAGKGDNGDAGAVRREIIASLRQMGSDVSFQEVSICVWICV